MRPSSRTATGPGVASIRRHSLPVQEGVADRLGGDGRGAEPERSPEHDCVMLELVLVAIVLGEPAVELWARLRALA